MSFVAENPLSEKFGHLMKSYLNGLTDKVAYRYSRPLTTFFVRSLNTVSPKQEKVMKKMAQIYGT